MKTEYTLSNSEGSILRVDEKEKCFLFFRDPWGRESSSYPDATFAFSKGLPENGEFVKILAELGEAERKEIEERCAADHP